MDKQECRQLARQRLAQLTPQALEGRGQAFCQKLLAMEDYQRAHTVFCYLSVEREPDTYPLIRQALAQGKRVCAPVCIRRGVMRARLLQSLEEQGSFFRVALCHGEALLDTVPTDPHDQRMDAIVTPEEVLFFDGRQGRL